MPRKSCARVYHFFAEWLPIHHLCIYVTYSIQKTYVIVPFGNGIALHVTMIMSLLTNLPETSGLFLMGTFLILAGLVLRRIFRMLENGDAGVSKRGPQSRQKPSEARPRRDYESAHVSATLAHIGGDFGYLFFPVMPEMRKTLPTVRILA